MRWTRPSSFAILETFQNFFLSTGKSFLSCDIIMIIVKSILVHGVAVAALESKKENSGQITLETSDTEK